MPRKIPTAYGFARCSRCKIQKPCDEFFGGKNGKHRSSYCRWCQDIMQRERNGATQRHKAPLGMRVCAICYETKSLDDFARRSYRSDVRSYYCKPCFSLYVQSDDKRHAAAIRRSKEKHAAFRKDRPVTGRKLIHFLPPQTFDDASIAYVAGLFDAEGTVTATRVKGRVNPRVAIYNCNTDVIRKARVVIGGSLGGSLSHDQHGICHFLALTNRPHIIGGLERLMPYLVLKKHRAQVMIELCKVPHGELAWEFCDCVKSINAHEALVTAECATPPVERDLDAITPEQWAYLAGYVDGDGSISMQVQCGTHIYPQVQIASTRTTALNWMWLTFGGSISVDHRVERHTPRGVLWFRSEHQVWRILRGILPYVIEKKERAQASLEALRHHSTERVDFLTEQQKRNLAVREGRPVPVSSEVTDA